MEHTAYTEAYVILQGLYKIYKEGDIETVALHNANMTIARGDFVAIKGRSGAGKSTLLNLISGLTIPNAGQILIGGVDLARMSESERAVFRRQTIGLVLQADNLVPFLTAYENVLLPMQLAGRKDASKRAHALLADVGMSHRLPYKPGMLSGGERQRVAIAVALSNEPNVLLADELTGELDSSNAEQVMALLGQLNLQHQLTLIVVTHNTTVAARARRQVQITDGQLIETEVVHA